MPQQDVLLSSTHAPNTGMPQQDGLLSSTHAPDTSMPQQGTLQSNVHAVILCSHYLACQPRAGCCRQLLYARSVAGSCCMRGLLQTGAVCAGCCRQVLHVRSVAGSCCMLGLLQTGAVCSGCCRQVLHVRSVAGSCCMRGLLQAAAACRIHPAVLLQPLRGCLVQQWRRQHTTCGCTPPAALG
eukprot:366399-Chlamydomonas_euryale.AAC.3